MALVINTRPADRNAELSALLRKAGFEPLEIPMVAIVADEEGLKRMRKLPPGNFTGIFLSSPNGLRQLESGLLATELEGWLEKPFYLVGPKSAPLVESLGGKVAFIPKEASLEGFLREYTPSAAAHSKASEGLLGTGLIIAQRWLHPCSASTRLDPAAFKQKNIGVENVPVYRPVLDPEAGQRLAAEGRSADAVVFCSGSAVEHFFQAAPELAARLGKAGGPLAISIGPSTSKTLADKGVEKYRQALHADDPSLVDALKAAFGGMATKVLKRQPEKAEAHKTASVPVAAPEAPAPRTPEPAEAESPAAGVSETIAAMAMVPGSGSIAADAILADAAVADAVTADALVAETALDDASATRAVPASEVLAQETAAADPGTQASDPSGAETRAEARDFEAEKDPEMKI